MTQRAINDDKRIVIVNAGGRLALSAEKGSYDDYVKILHEGIDSLIEKDENRRHKPVEVVKSTEEIGELQDGDTLIFVTLGMRRQAKMFKNRLPGLHVIVLTGLLPIAEIVIADKDWVRPKSLYAFAKGN